VLIIVLAILVAIAAIGTGVKLVASSVVGASLTAMIVDAMILRVQKKKWVFPDGALLTGLIVAMILSAHEPWYVSAITSAVAIVSKYMFRIRTANVFNPAALGLVATFYWFNTGQDWWGAMPELPILLVAVLFAAGAFITDRVNKVPAVLAFLGAYYLLVTITAFAGNAARVAELYRAPDLHMALFFAFFMVTDPPTSPPKNRDQIVFGAIVGAGSYAAFEFIGAAYYLLAGLLVANAWEAWRRARARGAKASSVRATALQS
jgi:Na+-translocating ferredoxin:NAD+ oxidoreductase RnfD subunit